MKNKSVRQMSLSALFIAIGVLLPIFFHAVGLGSVFSPMLLPVMLAGYFLSWQYALAVGVATPVLSSLITGMPPAFPVMAYMTPELAVYAVTISLIAYNSVKPARIYIALISAIILGRIVSGIAVVVLTHVFAAEMPGFFVFVWQAVTKGIPALIIQIVLIPVLVLGLRKALKRQSA